MRVLIITALFACSASLANGADISRNDPAPGPSSQSSATARQANGDAGATDISFPAPGRLTCRRYFGCVPAHRSAPGPNQD